VAKLSSKQRKKLPSRDFVFPDKAPGSGSYPIPDESHARNALARSAGKPEHAAVVRAVRRRYPNIDVSKSEFDITVPLWKNDEEQIVYGVVLSPELRDSQADIVDADDIRKAAHRFLVAYRQHDVQHAERQAGVETVESFIAPQDMEIEGQRVLKGAWVMATHVTDPEVWERVKKGEITGYSIGGSGVRVPEAV
jgi:hypothetical protein